MTLSHICIRLQNLLPATTAFIHAAAVPPSGPKAGSKGAGSPTVRGITRTAMPWLILWATMLGSCRLQADETAIEPEVVELGRPVEFERDIYPILQANCLACHNKAKSEGELNLENADSMLAGSSSGQVIVPGKPDESYLYNVAARIEESYMPPIPNEVQAQKLTPRQLGLLRQWILEGASRGTAGASAAMNWQPISEQLKAIYSVGVGPWGQYVAAGRAGNVHVYRLQDSDHSIILQDPELQPLKSKQQQTHRDYVHALAFRPDGNQIATAGYRIVKLWQRQTDVQNLMPERKVVGVQSSGPVAAVQFEDGTVQLLNADNRQLKLADLNADQVLGVHDDQAQRISVKTTTGGIQLMQTSDNAVLGTIDNPGAVPTQVVSLADAAQFLVLFADGTVKRLTLNPETKQLTVNEPLAVEAPVTALQARGALVLVTLGNGKLEVRKADSLQLVSTIEAGSLQGTAALSAEAQRVVAVQEDGTMRLWNTVDGKQVAELNSDLLAVRHHQTLVGEKAVRDARVNVVKGQVAEDEKRLKEQQDGLKKAAEAVEKATKDLAEAKKKPAEEEAKLAAAQKELEAKPDDAALKKKVEDATKAVKAANDAVAAAESTLASASKGQELAMQAVGRAEERLKQRQQALQTAEAQAKTAADHASQADAAAKQKLLHRFAGFAGTSEVMSVDQEGRVRLWKAADGTAIDVLPASDADIATTVQAVGVKDGLLLQNAEGRLRRVHARAVWKLAKRLGATAATEPSPFADRILALAYSPNGKLLATGGGEASRSGELMLWDVETGTVVRQFDDAHSDTVYGVEFSRDGSRLASAAADKFVKVFDVSSGEHVRSFEGHTHHVMDVSWKGDGTQLVSAGADNAIKVWNAETGEQARTINTYSKQVTALNFVGMTDEFVSCSGDRRVFRHRASNGGAVREFKGSPDFVYSSAITDDGSIVAAGGEDGVLRVWDGNNAKEIAAFAP